MGEKRLSEAIVYERDIEPYRVVEVISGVGSGKSYWAENELMQNHHVLLITSRKSKVEETQNRTGLRKKISWHTMNDMEIEQLISSEYNFEDNIICNNAHIEFYMKRMYSIKEESKHLWNLFDIIVVDEAHSLVTDATFADSPFHVLSFLKAAYQKSNAKIILMTATPSPINELVTESFPDCNYVDLMSECVNVSPERIKLGSYDIEINNICTLYKNKVLKGEKAHVIYFANHLENIKKTTERLIDAGIPEESIAISFSDKRKKEPDKESVGFNKSMLERKEYVEKYISENEDLPPEIFIFITTSRNKEGINLRNDDYKWFMITESHYIDDIKQMWGRARSGLVEFEIVHDIYQYPKQYCKDEPPFLLSKHCCKKANAALKEWFSFQKDTFKDYDSIMSGTSFANLYIAAENFINHIEEVLPFVRFNVYTGEFIQYRGRVLGNRQYAKWIDTYDYYMENAFNTEDFEDLINLFERDVKMYDGLCNLRSDPEYFKKAIAHKKIKEYLSIHNLLNRECINKDIEKTLIDMIFALGIKQLNGKAYSSLGKAMNACGFKVINGKHRKNSLKTIVEL